MKKYLGLIAAFLAGGLAFYLALWLQEPGTVQSGREWLLVTSNAALVPGVALLVLAGVSYVLGHGMFDRLRYRAGRFAARLFDAAPRYESFEAYQRRKRGLGAAKAFLFPGLFFMAAAMVLTFLYDM